MSVVTGNAPWYEKSGMIKLSSVIFNKIAYNYLLPFSFDFPISEYLTKYIFFDWDSSLKPAIFIYIPQTAIVNSSGISEIKKYTISFPVDAQYLGRMEKHLYYESTDNYFRLRVETIHFNYSKLIINEFIFFNDGRIQMKTSHNCELEITCNDPSITFPKKFTVGSGESYVFDKITDSNYSYPTITQYDDSITNTAKIIIGTLLMRSNLRSDLRDAVYVNIYSDPGNSECIRVKLNDNTTGFIRCDDSNNSNFKIKAKNKTLNIISGDQLSEDTYMEWQHIKLDEFKWCYNKGSITFDNLNSLEFTGSNYSNVYTVSESFVENEKFKDYNSSSPISHPANTLVRMDINYFEILSSWYAANYAIEEKNVHVGSSRYYWKEIFRYNLKEISDRVYHLVCFADCSVSNDNSDYQQTSAYIRYTYSEKYTSSGWLSSGDVIKADVFDFYALENRDLSDESANILELNSIACQPLSRSSSYYHNSSNLNDVYVKTKTAHKVV